MRSSYVIDKMCGVELPHQLLKSRGSVIRNNFLEYITNKATHFARRNDSYALLAKNKAKHLLNRLMVKVYRKIECKSGSRIIYFNEK